MVLERDSRLCYYIHREKSRLRITMFSFGRLWLFFFYLIIFLCNWDMLSLITSERLLSSLVTHSSNFETVSSSALNSIFVFLGRSVGLPIFSFDKSSPRFCHDISIMVVLTKVKRFFKLFSICVH